MTVYILKESAFRKGLLSLFPLFLYSVPSAAFNSDEHCGLSSLALEVALDIADSWPEAATHLGEFQSVRTQLLGAGAGCALSRGSDASTLGFSYGKITAMADFVIDPGEAIRAPGQPFGIPNSAADLNSGIFGAPSSATSNFALGIRRRLSGDFMRATNQNASHFQAAALAEHTRWHDFAVSAAGQPGGSLFGALVMNALADHYLQDVFAPGHIITPRENFPDSVAWAWHDRYNDIGLPVVVEHFSELQPILDVLAMNASRYGTAFAAIGVSSQQSAREDDLRSALRTLPALDETTCDKHDPHAPRAGVDMQGLDSSGPFVCLHGDGKLAGYPAQKLLMLAVQVQGILDVLRSHVDGRTNHFDRFYWCSQMQSRHAHKPARQLTQSSGKNVSPSIANACGDYLRSGGDYLRAQGQQFAWYSVAPLARLRYISYALEPRPEDIQFRIFDTLVGVSLFREGAWADGGSSRNVASIEALAFGIPGSPDYLRDADYIPLFPINLGLTFGYEHSFGNPSLSVSGPTARLLFVFPKSNLQLSLYARRLGYTTDFAHDHAWSYGVRGDVGFSLLTAFVAIGSDHGFGDTGVLESRKTIATGVTFAFSPGLERRIRRWLHH